MLSLSMYNEMKNEIFVFFSLLLDLANQDLRGKEEDLDETDKRESHAESEHPSDVGDECNWRHHLKHGRNHIILFFWATSRALTNKHIV